MVGPNPQIVGSGFVDETLTVDRGSWIDGTSFVYRWLRDGSPRTSWTDSSSLLLASTDYQHRISVQIRASHAGFAPVTLTSEAMTIKASPVLHPSIHINYSSYVHGELSGLGFAETTTSITADAPFFVSTNSTTSLSVTGGSQCWSGLSLPSFNWGTSVLSSANRVITANVWAPAANLPFRIQVDDSMSPSFSIYADAYTTKQGWQKLSWDFTATTPTDYALLDRNHLNTVSLFPGFDCGVPNADVAYDHADTWFIHDIAFNGAETALLESLAHKRFTRPLEISVVGKAHVGSILTSSHRQVSSRVTYSYQWLRNGVEIRGAKSRRYELRVEDLYASISVRTCAYKANYVTICSLGAADSGVKLGKYRNKPRLSISWKSSKMGITLIAKTGKWPSDAEITFTWFKDEEPVEMLNVDTYTTSMSDKGHTISVLITIYRPGYEVVQEHTTGKRIR